MTQHGLTQARLLMRIEPSSSSSADKSAGSERTGSNPLSHRPLLVPVSVTNNTSEQLNLQLSSRVQSPYNTMNTG